MRGLVITILGCCGMVCTAGDLLLSSNRVLEVRRRIAGDEGARDWWTNLTGRIETAMRGDASAPARGGQWYNYYFCKTCNERLETKGPTDHRCRRCGKSYAGWPYDDAALTLRHMDLAQCIREAGLAYLISGDAHYADFARRVLMDYAAKRPNYKLHDNWGKAHPSLGGYVTSQALDDAVWLIRAVQGFDAIRPSLSAEDIGCIAGSLLCPEADFLLSVDRNSERVGNHECWHAVAVGLAGEAIGREDYRAEARRRIRYQLDQGVDADGAWCEGSWGYHFYAMTALMNYFTVLHNRGEELPEAFHRMFRAPFGQIMSGWRLPANGDTDALPFAPGIRPELYVAASRFWPDDRELAEWGAASDKMDEAVALWGLPASCARREHWASEVARSSGMAVLREGTCADGSPKTSVAFDFGAHGGWHGHSDKLSYEIWRDGACVSDDPGCGNYAQPLHWAWNRQTLAHNTVSVDGKGQRPCTGRLLAFRQETNGMSAVVAAADIAEGVAMTRAVALVGDVILELTALQSDAEHAYDWAFHANGTFQTVLPLRAVSLGRKIVRDKLQPEDWNGSEAYTWLEGAKGSAHEGSWSARWTNGGSYVNVKQWSPSGELFTGLGWGSGGRTRETVVFNRVRAKSALFATVIDLASHDVGDIRVGRSENGVPCLSVAIDGTCHSLSL